MTDNAMAYRRSHAWRDALEQIGARSIFTRSYRPQTNGKAERFNRTLLEEWAYAQPFNNNTERAQHPPEATCSISTVLAVVASGHAGKRRR
jgi:transposase InsO family protein